MAKYRTLDEARKAYLNGKLTPEEYAAHLKKNLLADNNRREFDRKSKRIERKLELV
ncbi:hypothetical protein [Halalkalibacter krulwichiae]|uniref:Uncharacterized protein n=1 Tax=Halalkalibacter krulwichiae TaxID=199441 RepID=A0A1X9MF89_9BACI|nr:hypothetical protein [Halalkalibacter krulwichiae]ARK28810.1 hypothetical protein BkAM31D_02500 [Halalkalibacter krulwichiae]ARK32119.1 hypothetical protein BkAM31D_20995 [Halalkalibacter krulwichiae]